MRRLFQTTLPMLALAVSFAAGAGCAGPETIPTGHEAQSLAELPDCAYTAVTASFQAAPSTVDGLYVVKVGAATVCSTDFDGLQLLDHRFEAPAHGNIMDPNIAPAASDPMPGRGSDPAASDPMPGRGNDPAASDPMPGHGTNPAASDPMPGRNGAPIRAAQQLASSR